MQDPEGVLWRQQAHVVRPCLDLSGLHVPPPGAGMDAGTITDACDRINWTGKPFWWCRQGSPTCQPMPGPSPSPSPPPPPPSGVSGWWAAAFARAYLGTALKPSVLPLVTAPSQTCADVTGNLQHGYDILAASTVDKFNTVVDRSRYPCATSVGVAPSAGRTRLTGGSVTKNACYTRYSTVAGDPRVLTSPVAALRPSAIGVFASSGVTFWADVLAPANATYTLSLYTADIANTFPQMVRAPVATGRGCTWGECGSHSVFLFWPAGGQDSHAASRGGHAQLQCVGDAPVAGCLHGRWCR